MDQPKCRACGERHRIGECKFGRFGVRKAPPIPERKRESAAAVTKPGRNTGKVAGGVKARAGRIAGGRTPATGQDIRVPAPVVSKRGRPRIGEEGATLAATKPWVEAKMSERTWYRRQREAKK